MILGPGVGIRAPSRASILSFALNTLAYVNICTCTRPRCQQSRRQSTAHKDRLLPCTPVHRRYSSNCPLGVSARSHGADWAKVLETLAFPRHVSRNALQQRSNVTNRAQCVTICALQGKGVAPVWGPLVCQLIWRLTGGRAGPGARRHPPPLPGPPLLHRRGCAAWRPGDTKRRRLASAGRGKGSHPWRSTPRRIHRSNQPWRVP